MRCALLLVCGLALAAPALAQDSPDRCAPSPGGQVEVETTDLGTLAGSLFCLSGTEVSILRQGQQMVVPLAQVKRIRKPADPVWDGALKGAAVGVTMWGVSCGFCSEAAPFIWRATLGYAIIGAAWDGLQTNRKTIYVAPGRRSVAVRVGF